MSSGCKCSDMITILDIVFHAAFVATCTNEQPAFAIEPLNTPFVPPSQTQDPAQPHRLMISRSFNSPKVSCQYGAPFRPIASRLHGGMDLRFAYGVDSRNGHVG